MASETLATREQVRELVETTERIRAAVATVVTGRDELVALSVAVLLAEGHILLEDVPGVGKTTLAKGLARAIGCSENRIQFTPDLLPSDLTGVSIFRSQTNEFEFRPGPLFAQIVIGDEINRASPKTQSALLEAMAEQQATVDGKSYQLPRPFLVIATQNPIEMEGTYPLPEAQRDRFMARLSVGYPDADAEVELLGMQEVVNPIDLLRPVTDASTVLRLVETVRRIYASPALKRYVVDLIRATRSDQALRLGASPRAGIHLLRAAKAVAAMKGRDHVLPDDVQDIAVPVLAHRLLPSAETRIAGRSTQVVVSDLVAMVPVPSRHAL